MLKWVARGVVLHLFFFAMSDTGWAEDLDMSPLFQVTEKLMEKETDQFFVRQNQIELLNYMQKFNDRQGVARLTKKLSSYSASLRDIGTFTFHEKHIALALEYLGRKKEAKEKVEFALEYAPTLWLSRESESSLAYYPDLLGHYYSLGSGKAFDAAWKFIYQEAEYFKNKKQGYQLYLTLGLVWGQLGLRDQAVQDFQKATGVALTLQTGEGRKSERLNALLSIASFQGQAGLYDDMAKTISLIETHDGESLYAAWQTIKATLDLTAK